MKPPKRLFRDRPRAADDPSKCAILVPYMRHIEPECERKLRHAEDAGIGVVRLAGCSEISFCRSQMLSLALAEGKESVLFIDSDILFNVEDAIRILGRPEPIVAGLYSQKRFGKINANFIDNATPVVLGEGGGDRPVRHCGAGFLRIRKEACERIVVHHGLPPCANGDGPPVYPFFLPTVLEIDGEFRYLGEDTAFLERAWEAGVPVIADTTIRLFHIGIWPYGWEEVANMKVSRVGSVTIQP